MTVRTSMALGTLEALGVSEDSEATGAAFGASKVSEALAGMIVSLDSENSILQPCAVKGARVERRSGDNMIQPFDRDGTLVVRREVLSSRLS